MQKTKLIIFDCYGVVMNEGYSNTAKVLAKKFGNKWQDYYAIMYEKFFNMAATRKITQKQAWQKTVDHFDLPITWQELRDLHYSLMKRDERILILNQELNKAGYITLLLSKNTRSQFADVCKRFGLREEFKNIINTWELGLPKASRKTMNYVLNKFGVQPEEVVIVDDQEQNLLDSRKMGMNIVLYKYYEQLKKKLYKILKY